MKPTTLLALCVALLLPAAAWGVVDEVCTFDIGYSSFLWTSGVTGGPGFAGACTPSQDDKFIIPADATVLIEGANCNTDGAGWRVDNGGTFIMDARFAGAAVSFTGCVGHSEPEAGTSLYGMLGSHVKLFGCYEQFGVENPICQAERSLANRTMWTIDEVGLCGGGAGEVGDDCDDSSVPETDATITFYWSNARVNPQDGSTGDTWLEESTDEVDINTIWCTWDIEPNDDYVPGENGFCWDVEAMGHTNPFSISLNALQTHGTTGEYTGGWPAATREVNALTLYAPAEKGDTCIEVADDVISVDDIFNGRHIMIESTSLWENPLKILYTRNDEDCDGNDTSGGDGQDAIHFAPEMPIPEDIPVEAAGEYEAAIAYDFRRGDHGFVLVPIQFIDGTSDPADFFMYFAGSVSFHGVMIDGAAKMQIIGSGATIERWEDVILRDCGHTVATGPCLTIDGLQSDIMMKHVTLTGSSGNAAVDGVAFEDMGGTVKLQQWGIRGHDYSAITGSGSEGSNGALIAKNIVVGTHSTTGSGRKVGIDDLVKSFDSISLTDIYCDDGVEQKSNVGACVEMASDGPTIDINRMMAWSIRGNPLLGPGRVRDLVVRHMIPANTTTTILPATIYRFDIDDLQAATLTTTLNPSPTTWYDWRLHNLLVNGENLFDAGDGHVFYNGELSDFDTGATCTGDACDVWAYNFDDDTATVDVLERITVTLSEGATSSFTKIVNDEAGMDADADETRMGGLLITGFDSNATNRDGWGLAFDSATKVGYLDTRAGPFCFFDNSANGTGTWYDVDATPLASYAGIYYSGGQAPGFPDAVNARFDLPEHHWVSRLNCGAWTGNRRPGVWGRSTARLWSWAGLPPPAKLILYLDKEG